MKTRKRLNVRFLACVLGVVAVVALSVHFVHGFQVKRNAALCFARPTRPGRTRTPARKWNIWPATSALCRRTPTPWRRFGEALDEQAKKTGSIKGRVLAFFKLETVLRRDPERRDIRRRQVDTAMALGKFTDALAHLQVLHESASEDAELERLMGHCEAAAGRYREAVQAYELAIQHAPDQIDNYPRCRASARTVRQCQEGQPDTGGDGKGQSESVSGLPCPRALFSSGTMRNCPAQWRRRKRTWSRRATGSR